MKKIREKWTPPFKKFLFWWLPDGWEDLGSVGGTYIGNETYSYTSHSFCKLKAHIGRSGNGFLFYFCPKCRIQINKDDGSYLF